MWQSAQATPLRAWMPWLHSLELRVLRLEHLGAGLGVLPVVEAVAVGKLVVVVVALDLLDLQPVVPREEQRRLRTAVVLDVALAADERAHLLPRRVDVRVVGRRSRSPLPPALDALEVRRRRRAPAASAWMPRMNPGRVTRSSIASGSWQSTQLTGCAPSTCWNVVAVPPATGFDEPVFTTSACASRVRELAERLEALEHVAAARAAGRSGSPTRGSAGRRRAAAARSPAWSAPGPAACRRGRAGRGSRWRTRSRRTCA